MKGNKDIINALNGLLAYELAAMDQYFIHSRMYEDWGFNKLFVRIDHEFDDEKGHAPAEIMRDGAAQNSAHGRAQRHAERIDGQRSGALVRPIEIGNHGMAWRAGSSFADADADPREQQVQEIIGKAAQRSCPAP